MVNEIESNISNFVLIHRYIRMKKKLYLEILSKRHDLEVSDGTTREAELFPPKLSKPSENLKNSC